MGAELLAFKVRSYIREGLGGRGLLCIGLEIDCLKIDTLMMRGQELGMTMTEVVGGYRRST
jgi:hypothetical protein